MDYYAKYEKQCKKIKKANKQLLRDFEEWLKASNLSEKTIANHSSNIDFYINEFLLYEDAFEAREGVYSVDMYLGYWFIKKAMWASQASIKGNAASLKKFYTFMKEKGLVSGESLASLQTTIKDRLPEWLSTMARYDDLSVEDVWE